MKGSGGVSKHRRTAPKIDNMMQAAGAMHALSAHVHSTGADIALQRRESAPKRKTPASPDKKGKRAAQKKARRTTRRNG